MANKSDKNRTKLPKDILAIMGKQFNLQEHVIEHIVRSEFEFVKNTMSKREFTSVRLHRLGVFGLSEKRKQKILNMRDARRYKESNNQQ